MGITIINTAATVKHVSKLDSGYSKDGNHSPDSTVWELGAMDSYIESYVTSKNTAYSTPEGFDPEGMSEDEIEKQVEVSVDMYGMAIDTCRFCLRGWERLKDDQGNDVPFVTKKTQIKGRMYDAVPPDDIAKLPKDLIMDLYAKIKKISTLTEKEVKNSAGG